MTKKPISIRLKDNDIKLLKELSNKYNLSQSDLISKALKNYDPGTNNNNDYLTKVDVIEIVKQELLKHQATPTINKVVTPGKALTNNNSTYDIENYIKYIQDNKLDTLEPNKIKELIKMDISKHTDSNKFKNALSKLLDKSSISNSYVLEPIKENNKTIAYKLIIKA